MRRLRLTAAGAGLLGLILASSPLPTRASLRIAEGSPHARTWRLAYNTFPSVWKTDHTVVIREISDDEMDRLVSHSNGNDPEAPDNHDQDDSVIDGCYEDGGETEDDPATITLRAHMKNDESAMVFTHEYGHYVWDNLLNETQQARYVRCWRASKRSHHLVTRYAEDSAEEGFAEAFSFFLRKPDTLRGADMRAWKYFHDLLTEMQRAREADSQ